MCRVKRYKDENRLTNKTKSSSKEKLNRHGDKRWIFGKVKVDAPSIPTIIDIEKYIRKFLSAEYVENILNIHSRVAQRMRMVKVSKGNWNIYKTIYIGKDYHFWKNVICKDESVINLLNGRGKV